MRQAAAAKGVAENLQQHQAAIATLARTREANEWILTEKVAGIKTAEIEVQNKRQESKSSTSTLQQESVVVDGVEK
ncbi:hypothetical protein [Parasphingorhabdus sp.]|uniref:hypothetical protein n=1 Tax=Parasphingorhabdus sp. TaxID=2709688 RepID=UPI0032986845